MRMEPMAFDLGTCLHSEKELLKDGDSGVISSVEDHVAAKPPAKKQTRQWAAWTRQEEESFFTALRQVGKNFEKITCRVQSKNKDQVRHYYYRLVRRMNKLLGPELSLDAKNSKDTNAAMLRWWSLLEKYSCKASKLHLKPRRFKIFIENLENQLMKDRKRKIRKRHSQGGNCSSTPSQSVFNQGAVKPVLLDSQKLQKLASGKGSVVRRNANTATNRNSSKGDSSSVKAARQRRRSGTASTAAYKKWEKAAIAGVSLVADAAAHLEQATKDKLADLVQDSQGENGFDPVAKDIPSLPTFQQTMFTENVIQTSMKLKLQLFPIDEGTRRALEMDNHNPHLELTLSMRKKISSVVEHLHRKWGSSSIAFGELMLLPYCAQRENFGSCHKWAQDSVLSAADVYALTGSPTVFRLRYGWFQVPSPSREVLGQQTAYVNIMEKHNAVPVAVPAVTAGHDTENPLDSCKDQLLAEIIFTMAGSPDNFHNKVSECNSIETNKSVIGSSELPPSFPWQSRDAGTGAISKQLGCVDEKGSQRGTRLSAVEWADSLTNISVGDLLFEVSHNVDASYNDPHLPSGSHPLQQIPFSCDSFDAAIAAHLNKHQSKAVFQPTHSIWDAEETCDGFSFQKNSVFYREAQRADQVASTSSAALGTNKEILPVAEEPMDDDPAHGDPMDVCLPDRHPEDNSAKDLSGLNDIYWPDSLGPLDLDVPSCRYQSNELIFSDSLSGLNRLVNSSMDAFQSCSFYGLDKKETASTIEARETATFSDYKIGSEV